MTGVWIAIIALGGFFCLAGLAVGYLGLLAGIFPEKLRTREVGTVVTADLWKLRICRFRRGRTEGEPVLLVHGMVVNHHNFCEPANACLIDHLVERGYDCWALDLRGTRSSQAPFERDPMDVHLDDYLMQDIPAAIEHIRRATGYAKVHYVGHSLGGMLLYAYAQEFGTANIASGTTLGAPFGFDGVKPRLAMSLLPFVRRYPLLSVDLLKGLLPFVVPLRLNVSVFPMNPRNMHPSMRVKELYNTIDIPIPNVLTEMIHMLRRQVWRMKKDTLDVKAGLATMDFPLLAIYGPRDPFTPLDKARLFFEALPTDDKQMLVCSKENGCKEDYGHCDLAFGLDGQKAVFRPIAEWLAAHPIKGRMAQSPDDDAHIMTPLDGDTRAEMLSGNRYSMAQDVEAPASVIVEAPPEAKFPEETSEFLRDRQAALQGFAMKVAAASGTKPEPTPEPKPAAKPKAKAKPAAKKKSPARAKATDPKKRAARAAAHKAESVAKPKASAKPKAKAKPAAAKKPVAAPAKPKASAVKPKPVAKKPASTAKVAPKKPVAKAKPGTLDVLKAASEDLKKLDKRK